MKRFIIIAACILLVCGLAFWFISMPRGVSDQMAAGGVLDLTGAYSFCASKAALKVCTGSAGRGQSQRIRKSLLTAG